MSTVQFDADLIRRYDTAGPRYTSYPTGVAFGAFTEDEYKAHAYLSNEDPIPLPLSLYFHIPFCDTVCFYCACNKIVTKDRSKSEIYLQYLFREIEMQAKLYDRDRMVEQLHWGGGTPTFLNHEEMRALMAKIRQHFSLYDTDEGDYSIEIDPRSVTPETIGVLREIGFNRFSLGVQDVDKRVQIAVNRVQPIEQTLAVIEACRAYGAKSISVDLIYGLPKQTPASFARTLEQIVELKPDRIALYAYAHLPERFKPQRRIDAYELPAAADKIAMLANALSAFMRAGYVYVGMDHFALPDDDLAVAKRQGRLHRNFQGYSTQPDCDLISFGVSAIGRVGNTYSQNAKTLEEYYDAINLGHLPIVRGLALSRDDLVRRAVIMAIMCQGELQYEAIELAYMIDFKSYFANELELLAEQENTGMVVLEENGLQVTDMGWFFVRAIAMLFDRYLQTDRNRARFSKII